MQNDKWAFIQSTRFWAIVVIGIVGYLENLGYIGPNERELVCTIAGAFGIVRTFDRAVDRVTGK